MTDDDRLTAALALLALAAALLAWWLRRRDTRRRRPGFVYKRPDGIRVKKFTDELDEDEAIRQWAERRVRGAERRDNGDHF